MLVGGLSCCKTENTGKGMGVLLRVLVSIGTQHRSIVLLIGQSKMEMSILSRIGG